MAMTVTVVEAVMPSAVAVMVAEPGATASAIPVPAILATAVSLLSQLAVAVRSSVLPLVRVLMAVNWRAVPTAIVGFTGVTAIDCGAGGEATVRMAEPVTPARVAVMAAAPF